MARKRPSVVEQVGRQRTLAAAGAAARAARRTIPPHFPKLSPMDFIIKILLPRCCWVSAASVTPERQGIVRNANTRYWQAPSIFTQSTLKKSSLPP
jgi:hypothetical protein